MDAEMSRFEPKLYIFFFFCLFLPLYWNSFFWGFGSLIFVFLISSTFPLSQYCSKKVPRLMIYSRENGEKWSFLLLTCLPFLPGQCSPAGLVQPRFTCPMAYALCSQLGIMVQDLESWKIRIEKGHWASLVQNLNSELFSCRLALLILFLCLKKNVSDFKMRSLHLSS